MYFSFSSVLVFSAVVGFLHRGVYMFGCFPFWGSSGAELGLVVSCLGRERRNKAVCEMLVL
jgi:hypothetical protein